MFTMLLKHLSSLTTHLRYFYDILSGPGADKLLYLLIVILNSSLEKKFYSKYCFDRSFPNRELLICWFWAELNVRWRAFQRTLILIHRHLLNWIISMASKLCFLTQFIKFHSLWFFNIISWILSLRNDYFVLFTVFLKSFQFSTLLDNLYFVSFF